MTSLLVLIEFMPEAHLHGLRQLHQPVDQPEQMPYVLFAEVQLMMTQRVSE
jgi:hypothetical protein